MRLSLGLGIQRTKISAFVSAAINLLFSDGLDALDSRITFTRSTTGTRFNKSGLIETVAINAPRFDYNPVTLAPMGLLVEEQRANLMTYSADFTNAIWAIGDNGGAVVTADTDTAPDGTVSADTLNDNNASAILGRKNGIATTSGTSVYTASIFIKKNTSNCASIRVQLSGGTAVTGELVVNTATGAAQWRTGVSGTSFTSTQINNGWFRYSVSITDNASSNNSLSVEVRPAFASTYSPTIDLAATGSIFAWGGQVEVGSFATSYIPTTTVSVTRAADLAVMTGTSFSNWYSQSAGTFIIEFQSITNGKNSTGGNGFLFLYDIDNASTNNITLIASNGYGPGVESTIADAGVNQAVMRSSVALADGLTKKHALAYAANDFAACVNGGAVLTDTSGTVPSGMTRLTLGAQNATVGVNNFTGYIQRIAHHSRRLSNAELQSITA
ncbi:hypothetical protein UFOVP653_59 [uncultured Caudovirales phage]|uniref:Concanavalin A-like lectin/glucanases superfamily n=1 Tax=uncultured Caudovirales phage TaxID=2100421 RepID=A0A6J5NAC8_9CAUD|nr:hypothetical protein UFOVP653_59 [uncultured Caudovirales phage]